MSIHFTDIFQEYYTKEAFTIQEEVTDKTIALSIKTTKLTATVLHDAIKKFLDSQKHHSTKLHKGKQTLKQLMNHNAGVSNIEITDKNIKAFTATAKKYHVDFALKKDTSIPDETKYIVFFKGRDLDVITQAFKEFTSTQMKNQDKPSIHKIIEQIKTSSRERNSNHRERTKSKNRGRSI